MPTLLGLPNEILIDIIENVQFADIESVTLSCQHIRKLGLEMLNQHLSRKRRFTTVAIGQIQKMAWDDGAQMRGTNPIIPLRDFILDEQSALYPRTLIVGYIEDDMIGSLDLEIEEGEIADSDLVNIVAQLENQLLPKVLEVTHALGLDTGWTMNWTPTWTSSIVSGNLEAATCLLIALLPNLEKLRIVDRFRYYDSPPFYSTLDRLLKASTHSGRDLTGLNSFKSLSEVDLHGRYIDGKLERSSNVWPSVKSVIRDITNLEFYQSSIDTHSFYDCIIKIRSLQKFTYDFCAGTGVGFQPWEPRGIVGVLQLFARTSLVHLELTGVADIYTVKFRRGEPFIGSLRAFEVLETLRLETVMLYTEVEGTDDRTPDKQSGSEITEDDWAGGRNALVEPERLVDTLPASAKKLRLVGGLSNEEAAAMLADMVELKLERVPSLWKIFFEDIDPLEDD